jgi:molybdopterin adenylyltransferase
MQKAVRQVKVTAISISDSRTASNDISGDLLVECLIKSGFVDIEKVIISDEFDEIVSALYEYSKSSSLIISTGGTGFSPRDNTPEATKKIIEKETPGISEAMRNESQKKTPRAMLSRGVSGIRGNCLIINLPGSPKGVRECFDVIKDILPHAIDQIAGITKH